MENVEKISIEEYLKKIGFEQEEVEEILEYANSEIDRKVLHEKVKYLISLGLEARQIRIIYFFSFSPFIKISSSR